MKQKAIENIKLTQLYRFENNHVPKNFYERVSSFIKNDYFSFDSMLFFANLQIIDNNIVELLYIKLFRTFDDNAENLYNCKDTINYVRKVYYGQFLFENKIKHFLKLLKIKLSKNQYTYTFEMENKIELYYTLDETILKIKEFWQQYPNAIIHFC